MNRRDRLRPVFVDGLNKYEGLELKSWKEVKGEGIKLEISNKLQARLHMLIKDKWIPVGQFAVLTALIIENDIVAEFEPIEIAEKALDLDGISGKEYIITAHNSGIESKTSIKLYDKFPQTLFIKTQYCNKGASTIKIKGYIASRISLSADNKGLNPLWSYQSGSYEERPDWVLPLNTGFGQDNYMGMNATDYGGGTPVSCIWNGAFGIAVGHIETYPIDVSVPVYMPDEEKALTGIVHENACELKPGESFETVQTFIAAYEGDYFEALTRFRKIMEDKGLKPDVFTKEAYEPTWCAWGYGRNFKTPQIYEALPMVKELGIKWACLDDGWQTEEGDYTLVTEKFPNGNEDMKAFVDQVHANGMKAQLWWIPLAVDPKSNLFREHPEYIIKEADGSPRMISWWDCYYLCPSYAEVIEETRQALKKILVDWGFDGIKIDGQHLNAAPLCYNAEHKHEAPSDPYRQLPEIFKMIYETAKSINKDVTVMFCPCGTAYSFYNMMNYNIPVAADPLSSWQVRTKGRAFKALMGPTVPFHGDHVELSDGCMDFASTVGIGGVIGTKFTWPIGSNPDAPEGSEEDFDLYKDKEELWEKWIRIYNSKRLSEGEYIGTLYRIGFDLPEAHVVKKDGRMYYAFYADEWDGNIELRGLGDRAYEIIDIEQGTSLGKVNGPAAQLNVSFKGHLLLELI